MDNVHTCMLIIIARKRKGQDKEMQKPLITTHNA